MLDQLGEIRRIQNAGAVETFDPATDSLEALRNYLASLIRPPLDFWSVPQLSVVVPAVAANQALPDVVVAGLPAGATVVKAETIFMAWSISNAGGANKLSGAQHIQIQAAAAPGYADAISLVDDLFSVGAAAVNDQGCIVIGDHNVSAVVTGNGTYNLQWSLALADVAGLTFNVVQTGLRIWYSV